MDKTTNSSRFFGLFDREIDNAFTFIFSVMLAFATSFVIRLHSSNPSNISNITNAARHWDPETNYVRIIYIIVASMVIFCVLNIIRAKLGRRYLRILIALSATLIIFLGVMAPAYTASGIDMFHNGEQLGPTRAYVDGAKLFTNLFFLHGAGEDVLMPAAGFTLFNHGVPSIGSYVLMTIILQVISLFALFLLIGRIIKTNSLYLFTIIWFTGTTYSGFDLPKNIPVYAFIALLWLILNRNYSARKRLLIYISMGLIASLSLLYSLDVGVIMTLTTVGLAILLPFLKFDKIKTSFTLSKPVYIWKSFYDSLALLCGGLVGQLAIVLFLGISSYQEFIKMSVFEIPKYQGLMFDYPLSPVNDSTYLFWLPIILASIVGFGIINLIVQSCKTDKYVRRDVYFAFIMYGFALLYLRFGVGRPDTPHIASATCFLFLSGFYVVQLYINAFPKVNTKSTVYPALWVPALFLILLLWPQGTFSFSELFSAGNATPGQVKQILLLPKRPDSDWLNSEQRDVTNYITKNSTRKDGLFVLEPEPMYYYLTNRNNPSRFYITWFADPQQYTNELLASLKANPPKYIIYSGPSPYEISDSVPITARIPEVNTWILANYKTKIVIGQTTILSR